jgi:hypothetical protein
MSFGDLKVQDLIYEDSSNNEITVVIADLATKANPTFTGTVTVPTAPASDVSTKAASTAFVDAYYATKASPTFTGSPTVPGYAALAGAAFTGAVTGTDLTLSGNLVVNGTTTTINTQTLDVEDRNITMGNVSSPSNTTAEAGGLTLKGGSDGDKTLNWLAAPGFGVTQGWTSSENLCIASGKIFYSASSTTNKYLRVYAGGTTGLWDIYGNGANLEFMDHANSGSVIFNRNARLIDAKHIKFGAGDDMRLYSDGTYGYVQGDELRIGTASNTTNAVFTNTKFDFRKDVDLTNSAKLGIGGAFGSSGEVLTSGGSGAAPSWAAVPAGGNTVDLVADGAIAAGKPVFLTTAGKAKQIVQTVTERTSQLSSPNQSDSGNSMSGSGSAKTYRFNAITFSETSSTGGFFFRNYTTGNDLECRAFNLSSNGNANIPSAANVTVLSDDYDFISACWEATNNKFIIVARRDSDYKSYLTWVSVGSGTITASGNTFDINNVASNHPRCCDCGSGRVAAICDVEDSGVYENALTMYSWSGSNYTEGQMEFVAGSGTSSNPTNHSDIAYHVAEGKIVCVYHNQSNNVGCKIGTISGTGSSMTTSWGSEVTVASAAELPRVVVDVNTGKVVVTYVYTSSNAPYSKVGTISGTSISFGTEALVDIGVVDANNPNMFRPDLIYIKNLQKVIYAYTGLYGGNYYTVTRTGTVSGTGISWANQFQHWSNGVGIRGVTMVGLNNASKNKFVIGGRSDNHGDRGVFKTVDLTSAVSNLTDANDCIGFSSAAYSNGQTATIKTYGNTIDNLSGLTTGSLYYIQGNGTIGTSWDSANLSSFASNTPLAGTALSATKLLIRDPLART